MLGWHQIYMESGLVYRDLEDGFLKSLYSYSSTPLYIYIYIYNTNTQGQLDFLFLFVAWDGTKPPIQGLKSHHLDLLRDPNLYTSFFANWSRGETDGRIPTKKKRENLEPNSKVARYPGTNHESPRTPMKCWEIIESIEFPIASTLLTTSEKNIASDFPYL